MRALGAVHSAVAEGSQTQRPRKDFGMRGMDDLLDFAHELGLKPRTDFSWGTAGDQSWIRLQLPDRRFTGYGRTYDLAACDVLHTCRPDPLDRV